MLDPATTWTVVILFQAMICAAIGAAIGSPKGQAGLGLFLGLLFGVIGVIIVAVMGDSPQVAERKAQALALAVRGPAAAQAPRVDAETQLRKIEDLFARGVINADERAAARSQAIASASFDEPAPPPLPAEQGRKEQGGDDYDKKIHRWIVWIVIGLVSFIAIAVIAVLAK